MPFLTPLRVLPIRLTKKRMLLTELVYYDSILGKIVVPTGFISNYASIPEWIPRWLIDQDGPCIRDASVIHDFLYSNECHFDIVRIQADRILYRAMRELKASYFIAKMSYYAVRYGGQLHWRND